MDADIVARLLGEEGVVFSLAGIATIALAVSRLSLARDAWTMASFIGSETREEWKLDS